MIAEVREVIVFIAADILKEKIQIKGGLINLTGGIWLPQCISRKSVVRAKFFP